MMAVEYWIMFICLAIFGIIYLISKKIWKNSTLKKLQIMRQQLTNMPTKEFVSTNYKYIVSLDEKTKQINFTTKRWNKTYEIKDVVGCQVINHVATSQNTTTRKTVFGNLSSSTTTDTKVCQVELKISVNDTKRPNYSIFFFKNLNGVDYGHPKLEKARSIANDWNGIINSMSGNGIRVEGITGFISSQLPAQDSVADELIKISTLLQQGMITQEEYNSLKAKLIS